MPGTVLVTIDIVIRATVVSPFISLDCIGEGENKNQMNTLLKKKKNAIKCYCRHSSFGKVVKGLLWGNIYAET